MSVDKLVDSTQLDADLTSVANAIRTKGGTSASLAFPAGFVQAIGDIPSGGGGITDPSNDTFLAKFISGENIEEGLYLPLLTSLTRTQDLFGGAVTPFLHIVGSLTSGNYIFRNLATPIVVLEGASLGGNGFRSGGSVVETIDMDSGNLPAYAFNGCSALKTLILRKSSVMTLANSGTCVTGSPMAQGGSGTTVYVPNSLISTYQTASNWSTLKGWGTVTFVKIEGTIYETKYASGIAIS